MIVDIKTMGPRIYVCDVNESVFFVKYKAKENVLNIFADDTFPRFITCSALLDYNTIAVGDKFGNVAVVRLPTACNEDHEDDPASFWDRGYLNGASQKVRLALTLSMLSVSVANISLHAILEYGCFSAVDHRRLWA